MFLELLSTPRLPPVPEESAIASEEQLYRSGMSVDAFSSQGYSLSGNQNSNTVTMPTSQMSIHGTYVTNCEWKLMIKLYTV